MYVIYRPPLALMSNAFIDDLGTVLSAAVTHPNDAIICGDFNEHYANSQSTAADNLSDLLHNTDLVQHVTNSTCE